jgi:hypothetical protein
MTLTSTAATCRPRRAATSLEVVVVAGDDFVRVVVVAAVDIAITTSLFDVAVTVDADADSVVVEIDEDAAEIDEDAGAGGQKT